VIVASFEGLCKRFFVIRLVKHFVQRGTNVAQRFLFRKPQAEFWLNWFKFRQIRRAP